MKQIIHFFRKCQESDIDEVMEFVNETYQVETGDSGIGFKCVNRLTSRFVLYTIIEFSQNSLRRAVRCTQMRALLNPGWEMYSEIRLKKNNTL
jgi:hypothetical protein